MFDPLDFLNVFHWSDWGVSRDGPTVNNRLVQLVWLMVVAVSGVVAVSAVAHVPVWSPAVSGSAALVGLVCFVFARGSVGWTSTLVMSTVVGFAAATPAYWHYWSVLAA